MPVNGAVTYPSTQDASILQCVWICTTGVPDGSPLECPEWADRTVQAIGTFGGATCTMEGSNDGTNWAPLSNAAGGAAATFTVAGIKTLIENPRFIRPNLTVVGAGATITVTLLNRRANPMRT